MILTCVATAFFLLGFLTYHLFFCPVHPHHAPRLHFVNGCVDVTSIQCPKLLESLPTIDADQDGCVTKQEMRAAKKAMRHHKKPAPVDQEPEVNVDEAIAPVME